MSKSRALYIPILIALFVFGCTTSPSIKVHPDFKKPNNYAGIMNCLNEWKDNPNSELMQKIPVIGKIWSMSNGENGFIDITTTTGSNTGYTISIKEEIHKTGNCKYSFREVITWIS